MEVTIENIKSAMEGRKLIINICSFCRYPCGYLYRGTKLLYDAGCNCTRHYCIEPRDENEIIEFLNRNNLDIDWVKEHLEE